MTRIAYGRIRERLGNRVKTEQDTKLSAQCPAHPDTSPSLSVTDTSTRVLVKCHAGCATSDVLDALQLTMADLFDASTTRYDYPGGRTVFRTFDFGNGKKKFWQAGDTSTVQLYHLDRLQVSGDAVVYLVEGEEDVHALESLGAVATTAPQGASNFAKVDASPLAGRRVIAVVDRDSAGDTWAAAVHQLLAPVAARLGFVQAADGKDASDHVAAGYGLSDWQPYEHQLPDEPPSLASMLLDSHELSQLPDPIPLISGGVLYRDTLAWLLGKPGSAKSFTAIDMAGCIGTGMTWYHHPVTQGQVLYVVAEGETGIKRRVHAWEEHHGHKMTGVKFLPYPVQVMGDRWLELVQVAQQLQPVLIIVDTQARVTVGVDENSNTAVGEVIHRLDILRRTSGACVLLVHHLGRAGSWARGASAMDGAAATMMAVERTGDQVTLSCSKTKDDRDWDNVQLRMIQVKESAVLIQDAIQPSYGGFPPFIFKWWDLFKDRDTSVSDLVETKVTSKGSLYNYRESLLKNGIMEQTGTTNRVKFKLTRNPHLPLQTMDE